MKKLLGSTMGRVVALAVVAAMSMVSLQAATAVGSEDRAGATERRVAHTKAGDLNSRIVGTASKGRKVTGSFVPLKFIERNGTVAVRGLVQGVVHERNGERTTFATLKTLKLQTVNGKPLTSTAGGPVGLRATCDILSLVLAPLDLDILGLKVHLDRVVLTIVAESGAGNLLGNLLCAVTGLFDNPLAGLLGQLSDLLNQILGALRLGG